MSGPSAPSDVTTLVLERIRGADAGARAELVSRLYERFRERAHAQLQHERPGHSYASTDLMHEALLRLWKGDEFAKAGNGNELFRAFARAMRQALVDRARRRNTDKRGGHFRREPLDDLVDDVRHRSAADVVALDEALTRLAEALPREATILEMRFFGGHAVVEIAEALSVSVSTVERDSRFGLAWLRDFLSEEATHASAS